MLLIVLCLCAQFASAAGFDELWRSYHAAGDPAGREVVWAALRDAGWPEDFDATLQRLRARSYESDVPRGELHLQRSDLDGRVYRFLVLVPESYDSSRSYPLQVVLHGSTRRPAWRDDERHWRWLDPFRSETTISVFPAAWEDAMWWSQRQVENLAAILDRLRADYNVDSNRCALTGLSDGGTGTFYHALRAPTPWSCFLPLIGHPWVFGNPEEGADGDVFAVNLHGRALFVVNGRDDHLYPAAALEPYLDLFRRAGAELRFEVQPGGHNVRWWPDNAEQFRAFREAHPRDPFPDTLVWETDDPRRNGRAYWLRIDAIGDEPSPDPDPLNTVLFPSLDPPTRAVAFPRRGPSGRVEATRDGNTISIESRNVLGLTLLLGVDEFDLDRPLRVLWNGSESEHSVSRSVPAMMEWALRDGDPQMLFAAEIRLREQR